MPSFIDFWGDECPPPVPPPMIVDLPFAIHTQLSAAAQVSVFEWVLVGPKGQGHTYVRAAATNFSDDSFHKMSEIYLVIYCGA